MMKIVNPHDRFFKEIFTRPEAARDFVRHYLPADVAALVDTDSMIVCKDSFVDTGLREFFADLLYIASLTTGGEAGIYLLFEHKSASERMVVFHLLRYMVKIWEQSLKENEIPPFLPIIPIVVYHGKIGWTAKTTFRSFIDPPKAVEKYVPDFEYALCDLRKYRDEEIKGAVLLKASLLLMKHIFDSDLAEKLPGIIKLLRALSDSDTAMEYLETMLKYLSSGSSINKETLKETVIKPFTNQGGDIMQTLAEQWIEQGKQEGIKDGQLQNSREMLVDTLEMRFDMVPGSIITAIQNIHEIDILKRLHKKAIMSDSLEKFKHVLKIMME